MNVLQLKEALDALIAQNMGDLPVGLIDNSGDCYAVQDVRYLVQVSAVVNIGLESGNYLGTTVKGVSGYLMKGGSIL